MARRDLWMYERDDGSWFVTALGGRRRRPHTIMEDFRSEEDARHAIDHLIETSPFPETWKEITDLYER